MFFKDKLRNTLPFFYRLAQSSTPIFFKTNQIQIKSNSLNDFDCHYIAL